MSSQASTCTNRLNNISLHIACLLLGGLSLLPMTANAERAKLDLASDFLSNPTAYIPSQCYTKTETKHEEGEVFNPCYSCHRSSEAPNYINDWAQQEEYIFPTIGYKNHWTNLFIDRSKEVDAMSDNEIIGYINQSNYINDKGELLLTNKLVHLPKNWDVNKDGKWNGYVPDLYYNFDNEGFDRRPNGEDSGWRAFAYYPVNGTFWPTNGSTDDVFIRLGDVFRTDSKGRYSRDIYKLNLAIVESLIKRKNIEITPTDEHIYGVDLNKNGKLDQANEIVFDWRPIAGRYMSYVGMAKESLAEGKIHLAAGLYPEGTEFLHSVRYVGVGDSANNQQIELSSRMKELRYMRKDIWHTYGELENLALAELKEADAFPDRLPQFTGNAEIGVFNKSGWVLQGFIEDSVGELRPQTYEETIFCMGCHGGVGATTDAVFSFSRKFSADDLAQGWYHWTQKGLEGAKEPKVEDENGKVSYAYTQYLMANHSGNEFRNNDEVANKFFTANGQPKPEMFNRLHQDISVLLYPSRERALQLNKAYRVIVSQQSFTLGRDATIKPVRNVYSDVPVEEKTGITKTINPIKFIQP